MHACVRACVCVCVCVCKFSETIGRTKAKFHVAPPCDRGKDGKRIQMIQVSCCYSLLSTPEGGGILQEFYHKFGPAVLSRALKIET